DAGCYATLANFPAWPVVWLERGDNASLQDALDRAAYLAKEYTKVNGTGERNFGCSRS
ncbi:TPA: inovirus Gp2 family protein, partial [Escherichia coli]|nr:inovirus Gp2 family protein [Escherichia coli]